MRQLKLYWRGECVGTVECPDSYRPPITQAFLDAIPAMLICQSRSWLFDVRVNDFRLELRGEGRNEEVVIVASDRLGPGDIGCIVGFSPATGRENLAPDEGAIALAAEIMGRHC